MKPRYNEAPKELGKMSVICNGVFIPIHFTVSDFRRVKNIVRDVSDFVFRATQYNFCRALSCNFKIARVNHLRFCCRDIAEVSNPFET